jgi:hypothetical protein
MSFAVVSGRKELRINVAFYNVLGQMLIEFPSTFVIEQTSA